ncbi:MAG: hypothetical protein L3J02_00890 [Henriciella sp.]|nr:hypothetical protein [Henriciella sp.]
MLHPSTKKLIDRLAEMTERGKLEWSDGPDDAVTYVTEGYSVSLLAQLNELVITSKDGKELERATADELNATPTESGGTYSHVVAAMTKEATRVARGTESAISTLLAGIDIDSDEIPDVAAEDAPEEVLGAEARIEDIVDDTAALSADDVAGIKTVNAPVETDRMPETSAPETEAAPTEGDASTFAEEATASDHPPAAEVSEPDGVANVTEAVQRMAAEVNERENNAATAGAAALAATAAGIAMADKTNENPPVERPEPAPILEATENHQYVPFDLEADTDLSVEVTPEAESISEASTPDDGVTLSRTADEADNTVTEIAEDPALEIADTTDTPTDMATERDDAPEATAGSEANSVEEGAPETSETVANTPIEAFSTPVSTASVAVETIETESDDIATDVTDAVEAAVTTITEPEPRSFSLSGMGAGFGLGALTSTTEATGTPSVTALPAAADERIIIDATDDVPLMQPEPESDSLPSSTLPDVAELTQPPAIPVKDAPPAEEANNADKESDVTLKPRTRFNPWN